MTRRLANIVINDFTHDARVLKTSLSLKSLGYDVTVVALHNGDLPVDEQIQGVFVNRIKLVTRSWIKFRPIQFLKYFEFLFRAIKYSREFDYLNCNDLNALPVGVIVKLLNSRVRLVYDSHEFAINDVPNQSRISIKLKYFFEKLLIKYADHVVVVSDSIANEYVKLYDIKKPYVVLNCPSYTDQTKKNIFRIKFNIRQDQKIFLYQGGLSKGRGIEVLLQSFFERKVDDCVLICMGYGLLEDVIRTYAKRSSVIFYHPAVSQDVLLDHTSSADIGLSLIEDACMSYRYCLPNKLFEYIMASLPVIASDLPEMRRLVDLEGIGLVVEDNTIEGMQMAINEIMASDLEKFSANVREASNKYCWENQVTVLQHCWGGNH